MCACQDCKATPCVLSWKGLKHKLLLIQAHGTTKVLLHICTGSLLFSVSITSKKTHARHVWMKQRGMNGLLQSAQQS